MWRIYRGGARPAVEAAALSQPMLTKFCDAIRHRNELQKPYGLFSIDMDRKHVSLVRWGIL